MSLLKCPICGEMYSDSYKACPFCAESGPYEGTVKRRKLPGRRVERGRRQPRILGPAMVLVVLLLAAFLIYTFFGDRISKYLHRNDPVDPTPVHEVVITVEPALVELNVGEIRALTASGAEGYVWSSSDPAVVTVDEQGSVTAVAPGTATITVKDADDKASARAEIKVFAPAEPGNTEPEPGNTEPEPGNTEPEPEPGNTEPEPGNTEPEPATLTLGSLERGGAPITWTFYDENGEFFYDLTLGSGSTVHLIVIGTESPVVWESSTSAVTVTDEGAVTRVGVGTAIITATVDGQTLKCRVIGG